MTELPTVTLKNGAEQTVSGHAGFPAGNRINNRILKSGTAVKNADKPGSGKRIKNPHFEMLLKSKLSDVSDKRTDKQLGKHSVGRVSNEFMQSVAQIKKNSKTESKTESKTSSKDEGKSSLLKKVSLDDWSKSETQIEPVSMKHSPVERNQEKGSSEQPPSDSVALNRKNPVLQFRAGIPELTSKADKVDIIDRRSFAAAHVRSSRRTRKTGKEGASSGTESLSQENQILKNARPAVVETEIGISKEDGTWSKNESAAESLARKIDSQAGSELVKQVRVVLNRSESGEIRINLKPDNLGRVRIDIQMENNAITGRIFVDSAAAREAFQASLEGLQTKLLESGFSAADLELHWNQHDGGQHRGKERRLLMDQDNRWNHNRAVKEFDDTATLVLSEINGRINMVV